MALVDQMMRASRLDISLYEEVESDTTQTNNALTVVVITAVAAGIGTAIASAMAGTGGGTVVLGLVAGIIGQLVSWALWTFIVFFIGTRLFKGTATWGEVLRSVGFAYSPNVLRVLAFIPVLGGLINLLVSIWTIVTVVVAVRQSLDISTGAAIVVSIIGAIVAAIVLAIVAGIFAIPALMMAGGM